MYLTSFYNHHMQELCDYGPLQLLLTFKGGPPKSMEEKTLPAEQLLSKPDRQLVSIFQNLMAQAGAKRIK